uniref:Uncharacterized protein n=1 Tax=Salvator merianae TaxID=96440 RepID=A0A8D0BK17_SALMN
MTPFSGVALPPQSFTARHGNAARQSIYGMVPSNKDSRKGSSSKPASLDNSISLQEAVALFPSLQRLSAKGDRFLRSTLHLHNPVSGLPAMQKKIRSMMEREWDEEKYRPLESLPQIKPEEFLSCRYLRLSQSNIDTLLELCKESGIYVDLHPHMKESEIDFTTVLSTHPSKSF